MDTRERLIFLIQYELGRFKPRPRWGGRWHQDEPTMRRLAETIADKLMGGLDVRLRGETPVAPASFPKCPRGF